MYHTEPQSAPRFLLNTKKVAQPGSARIMTGTLTASQAAAAAAKVFANSRSRPARRHSSSSAPSTTSG